MPSRGHPENNVKVGLWPRDNQWGCEQDHSRKGQFVGFDWDWVQEHQRSRISLRSVLDPIKLKEVNQWTDWIVFEHEKRIKLLPLIFNLETESKSSNWLREFVFWGKSIVYSEKRDNLCTFDCG